ncbi:ribonuclease 16-like precursor [Rattus norvegicus]|uniref:Eosinophil-associated, ribonuclease A family, member 1 like 1 n=1 Tax=Rattus norvegicus TaxID=10116 RepID=Q5GAM3_RAT|nr:ribonuclease 16-like precursor [Rattus norvegicus]AAV87196.1 ribonuclease 16 [Rattus norvegicus]CDG32037.1 TPA: ribonuclease A f2 [Rattus norvegicus]|eukprot:XP_002728237.1 PREDICTED: eosinophil cationic protein [Rattus norvegicus]
MGLKLLESRLCLLLPLGLVLMLASCQRPTPSQRFAIQHIYNSAYPQCNAAMQRVNNYTGRCKDINTFLHTSFASVVGVCGNRNTTCNSNRTRTNCHDSTYQVKVTICNLTNRAAVYPQCPYQTINSSKFYRVACDPRTPRDNRTYPVVPVHLDFIF